MSFIAGLKTSSSELTELSKLFKEIDESKDGFLSPEEIQKGLSKITARLGSMNY